MAEIDPNVILLTIGQPDISVSDELTNITIKAIKEGRTGYSNGRGEQNLVSSLVKSIITNVGLISPKIMCCVSWNSNLTFCIDYGLN